VSVGYKTVEVYAHVIDDALCTVSAGSYQDRLPSIQGPEKNENVRPLPQTLAKKPDM
jgi:hypothetical protein